MDLFLLAGDMIYRGRVNEFNTVLKAIKNRFDVPIIACFGNEEYDECIPSLIRNFSDEVRWLNDEYIKIKIKSFRLGIIGSRGCLLYTSPSPRDRG